MDTFINIAAMITLGGLIGIIVGPFLVAIWAIFKSM
jgi:hypothetical protein